MKRHLTGKSLSRIIVLYLFFGGLWIAVSDRILEAFIPEGHELTVVQTYKGWFFVAASALFLYFVVRHEFHARDRTEAALRESEEKYRLLMQQANDGIVIADFESGKIVEVNRKIEELTGLSERQLSGRRLSELGNTDQCRALLEEVLRKPSMTGEFCIFHRSGSDTLVEISASVVQIDGRKMVQGVLRDMTQRKAAEEAMRKEKERAERYLEIAGVMIVVLDREGRIVLINRKGSDILGYPEQEIVGRQWFDVSVPERMRDQMKRGYGQLMNRGTTPVEFYEAPVVTKSGEERMMSWHFALLKDEAGRATGILVSGEDITARKYAEEQARNRLEHLSALHAIDLIISSTLDLRVTLQEFLDLVITQLHVDAADVLLLNPRTKMLEYAAMQGFRSPQIRNTRLRLGEGIAGRAALDRRNIGIPNLLEPGAGYAQSPLLEGEKFVAYYVVPLIAKGQVKGVLEVLHRSPLSFNEESISFLDALAAQAAIVIDNATLFSDLQRSNEELVLAYDSTIEGWARALELRDQETEGHTQRAAELTLQIASAMRIKEEEMVHVRRGALLHDIGKMSIPDSILFKKGPLTEEEWKIMRRHPVYAYQLLSRIAYLRPAIDIPYCHHERWDGKGYPRGLKGEEIPLSARIFAVADTWDALYSERRYHPAWPEERVREHIRSLAGTQLDPDVVDVFLNMMLAHREKTGSSERK